MKLSENDIMKQQEKRNAMATTRNKMKLKLSIHELTYISGKRAWQVAFQVEVSDAHAPRRPRIFTCCVVTALRRRAAPDAPAERGDYSRPRQSVVRGSIEPVLALGHDGAWPK
jgi:hypothetical protein